MASVLAGLNLNRLVVFAAVVEAGSLTAAAARLGMTKTMVSAHMQRLEAELGAHLLVRTTRRLGLTEAGEAFHEAVRQIVQSTEQAVNALGRDSAELRGTLRIAAPVDYSGSVVMPLAAELAQRHPLLKIDIVAGDRIVDLVAEGIDVAIRIGKLSDSSHQAVRLAAMESWLVAAPAAFEALRDATRPEQIAELPFIALTVLPQPLTWAFEGPAKERRTVHFRAQLSANTAVATRAAVLQGAGLAVLPDYSVAADVQAGRLVRVLPDWSAPGGGVYAVYPATRHRPHKVRVWVDALRARLQEGPR
jgi:DNA-binding transcriptional LysR family regulator